MEASLSWLRDWLVSFKFRSSWSSESGSVAMVPKHRRLFCSVYNKDCRDCWVRRWDHNLAPHRGSSASLWFPPNTPFTYPEIILPLPLNTGRNPSYSSKPEAPTYVRFLGANCYRKTIRSTYQPSRSPCLAKAPWGAVSLLKWSSNKMLKKATGYTSPCLIRSLYQLWAPPPSEGLAPSPVVSTVGPVLEAFPGITLPSPHKGGPELSTALKCLLQRAGIWTQKWTAS